MLQTVRSNPFHEYLTFQTGASQGLVSKNSVQNSNEKLPKTFTTKILNHEGLNWVIQCL